MRSQCKDTKCEQEKLLTVSPFSPKPDSNNNLQIRNNFPLTPAFSALPRFYLCRTRFSFFLTESQKYSNLTYALKVLSFLLGLVLSVCVCVCVCVYFYSSYFMCIVCIFLCVIAFYRTHYRVV